MGYVTFEMLNEHTFAPSTIALFKEARQISEPLSHITFARFLNGELGVGKSYFQNPNFVKPRTDEAIRILQLFFNENQWKEYRKSTKNRNEKVTFQQMLDYSYKKAMRITKGGK